ncbi:hypothetical protein QUF94_24980 [Peribacillus sp. NJ4]|uniref:hypothetical protein n=1 Tax=Peribacillus sp. NJ4 TaxID=3055862 RepID=UPI0025A0D00D|nr:hypothetical protein [Peribacillus sp. NJ4]MDM5214641.1 hypothetical protein [Peribacillus sp. NJ4]
MIWINIGISVGTILVSALTLYFTISNSKKTRRITVLLSEKQKRHEEVFKHITSILDLGRKSYDVEEIEDRPKMKYEFLNHKVLIWVYLNKENKYAKEMRGYCNDYVFACVSILEKDTKEERQNYLLSANKYAQHIWLLIDKYIEEEDKLRSKLI